MTLEPLPVPTKLYRGESVVSYGRRHAARNRSQVTEIEDGLRQHGIRLRKAQSAPERLDVWRQLGNLHPSAFTTPAKIDGDPVADRRLCLRCTHGNPATGRLPHVGMACLRHKRWLGAPQIDLHRYIPALTAERHFRTRLACRGVLFDSFAMELGRTCANPMFVGDREIRQRIERTDIHVIDVLVYPEQVKLARLLTTPTFLTYLTDPSLGAHDRRARIASEVSKIFSPQHDSEPWRGCERIWDIARRLTTLRRDAALWATPVHDAHYNLLRFMDPPDLADEDRWDDYEVRPRRGTGGDHAVSHSVGYVGRQQPGISTTPPNGPSD